MLYVASEYQNLLLLIFNVREHSFVDASGKITFCDFAIEHEFL